MPISVDALRGLAASQTVVFDGASQTLGKASAGHSVASFLGTKAAKAVNRETMAAIKNAALSDPRYFGARERAVQMLSSLDNGGKVDSSKIRSIVNHLDSITTPEMQKEQLLERFTLHLSNRELPEGWTPHVSRLISCLNRNMDTFIRDAGGNAGDVNASLVIANMCEILSAVTEASGGDARAIDLAAALLAYRPQVIDTPEKARDIIGRWVTALNNGEPDVGGRLINTMFTGTAGADGDRIVSERRDQMKVLQFCQREMPETLMNPDAYLRNRISERCKVRMNEDFSLSMHRFKAGEVTVFEKDIPRSMNVTLPNGVRLHNDFALAREEVAKYVTGNPDVTFADLDGAARNKAWLLMSLISQETEKLALEEAPDACCIDGQRPAYVIKSGTASRSFTVSESADGGWIVKNDASYGLNGVLFDENSALMVGPDARLHTSAEICIPRKEIDRIAGLDESVFTGVGAVNLDAAVSVSIVHDLVPPLEEEDNARYDISQIPIRLGLTDTETRLFETVAGYETEILGGAVNALPVLKHSNAPARQLLFYPAFLSDKATYERGKELMTVFNRVLDSLTEGKNPAIPKNYRKTVERFVFDELNALAASGGKLPSSRDFERKLVSGNPYLDFARWGFDSAAITHSLLAMPVEFRKPIMAALKAYHESSDINLFNQLVVHREGMLRLHSHGKMTVASIYAEIMGNDAPFTSKTPAADVRNYFGVKLTNEAENYASKKAEEKPGVMEAIGSVFPLLSKYSMSVEDAFSIALGERHVEGDHEILNPFEPVVYQRIGNDVSKALEGLAGDLNRMNYGYAVDGRAAKVAEGSLFTFHLPDGVDATVSSLPVGMDAKQLTQYNLGKSSSLTRLLGIYAWKLCGVGHERQVESLILGLGQGCLAPLRNMAKIYGVEANEHSQVVIDLRRIENGDVELRVSNPENCPLEFDWTVTVSPDGRQKVSEVNMRRAERFVAAGEEK